MHIGGETGSSVSADLIRRMVVGSLLGSHHRIDWKECGQSEADEKKDALEFKKAFTAFHS